MYQHPATALAAEHRGRLRTEACKERLALLATCCSAMSRLVSRVRQTA